MPEDHNQYGKKFGCGKIFAEIRINLSLHTLSYIENLRFIRFVTRLILSGLNGEMEFLMLI